MLREYKTPITLKADDIKLYDLSRECPKEVLEAVRAEAVKRGFIVFFTSYVSDEIYFIDPRPAKYCQGYERLDEFFDWCEENHLLRQRKACEFDRKNFGHRHDYCHQLIGTNKLEIKEAWNRSKFWHGNDPKACYCYGYTTYDSFFVVRPHASLDYQTAARLLQEHLDYLHECNPREHEKFTIKVQRGHHNYEGQNAPDYERIVVYYGDGKRGAYDYHTTIAGAEIYLNENKVVFSNEQGYDIEVEGNFHVLK